MIRWLGLDDWKSAVTLIGCILAVVLLLGILPFWLRRQGNMDFAGTAVQTVPGQVTLVTISPVSQGGGDLFNAVGITFAGHQQYYALPRHSQWKPVYGQPVAVTYQVGRSGQIRLDAVLPTGQAQRASP